MPRWSKSFFIRLVLSYYIFAFLLVGTAGGYLYSRTNAMMLQEMSKDSYYTLNKIKDYISDTLLRKFEDTFVTKAMTTLNPDSTDTLKVLLAQNESADYMYEIMNLVNDMGNITNANEGLAGITIYFKRGQYVVDERYYYHQPDHSPDNTFIQSLDERVPYQWFYRMKGGSGEPVLTYVYTLPYKYIQKYTQAYLYIDISLAHLSQVIQHLLSSPNEKLLVFNEEGRLILQNEPVDARTMTFIQDAAIHSKQSDFTIAKDPDSNNIIAYLPNTASANGWRYVIVKPVSSFYLMTEKLKNDIIWICSSILFLGLLSAYIVSNRFSLPLKKLLLRIGDHYGNMGQMRKDNNEYNVIHTFIQDTDRKLNHLQRQLYSKNVLNLVYGNMSGIDDSTLLPHYPRYVPVHIRVEAGAVPPLTEVFDKTLAVMPFDIAAVHMQEAILLFYASDTEQDAAGEAYREIQRFMERYAEPLPIAAGIGDAVDAMAEIHQAYKHAEYASSYSFIFGYPAIIRYVTIKDRKPLHIPFSSEPYFNALRTGDLQLVEPIIEKYAQELSGATITVESLEVNMMQFVTSLSVFIIDHDLQQVVPVAKLFSDAIKPTFGETMQWIREINILIASHFAQRVTSGHLQLVQELKRYIDEHSEEDISLDLLAEKSDLSPNYVSTLFKEVMHLPVIEYLHHVRLEKAAALLHETNTTVSVISEQVGYRYSQYFCRKFKEKYGVTPLQYRQSAKGE